MNGMEMMLASLLGISKEEMRDTINNAVTLLGGMDARFKEIERKQDLLLSFFVNKPEFLGDITDDEIPADT